MRTLEQKQQQFAEVKELLEKELGVKTQQTELGFYSYIQYFQQCLEIYFLYNRSKFGRTCNFNGEEYLTTEFKLGNKKVVAINVPCKNFVYVYVYSAYDLDYTVIDANYFLETSV